MKTKVPYTKPESKRVGVNKVAMRVLLVYWVVVVVVYLFGGWFYDLYTSHESGKLAFILGVMILPMVVYTSKILLPELAWPWYGQAFMALVVFGLYLGSAYFTVKELDLVWSVAIRPVTAHQLPVTSVEKVFAGRAGFTHTNVTVKYRNKPVAFEADRSSYFLLKNKKLITGNMGITPLNEYFVIGLQVPGHGRWQARREYWHDWLQRYRFLGFIILAMILWYAVKSKLFAGRLNR
jgi:hypothetical protein